jgi:hypothetical protein
LSRSAVVLATLALLLLATPAQASPRRVAVLEADLELLRALHLALSPWDVTTVQSSAPAESLASDPIRVASGLAKQLEVEAVVWISRTERGSLLWVFDDDTGEVSTRLLSAAPPFDGAAAAAVALSVKTVLRATVVAPPAERFGAQVAPSAPAEVEHTLALELGVSFTLVDRRKVEPRLEAAPVLWLTKYIGLSVEASAGTGVALESARFRGRYSELVLGGEARLRLPLAAQLSTLVSLGGSAHFSAFRGQLDGSLELGVRRLNASLDAEVSASVAVGSGVYLGATLGASYFPVYRRYLIRGAPLFTPGPFTQSLGGFCGLEID